MIFFKQLVICIGLTSSFFSSFLHGMEKSLSQEEIESVEGMLAFLKDLDSKDLDLKDDSKQIQQIKPIYLFKGDESSRQAKWQRNNHLVEQEKDTTKGEETLRIKLAAKKCRSLDNPRSKSLSTNIYTITEDGKPKPRTKKKTINLKESLNSIQE